jgi:hypothetical protein
MANFPTGDEGPRSGGESRKARQSTVSTRDIFGLIDYRFRSTPFQGVGTGSIPVGATCRGKL